MTYEPPIDNGPSSLLEDQAIEIADLKAEVERLKAERDEAAPAWRDRPTGPGLWVCFSDDEERAPYFWTTLKLDADAIARGAPFRTKRVYGPIPEDAR